VYGKGNPINIVSGASTMDACHHLVNVANDIDFKYRLSHLVVYLK